MWSEEESHPAYARILDELAPDEARILLLLLRGGPQPSVDVRTGGPVGLVSSALVAPGMSMIGARAGCRYLDEVPAYLNNLFRLGLIWFSREQLEDPMEYQVVEAQPDVLEAMHSVRFPKVVRRSIHLTPFGAGFCQACLVDPEETADAARRTRSPRSSPGRPENGSGHAGARPRQRKPTPTGAGRSDRMGVKSRSRRIGSEDGLLRIGLRGRALAALAGGGGATTPTEITEIKSGCNDTLDANPDPAHLWLLRGCVVGG